MHTPTSRTVRTLLIASVAVLAAALAGCSSATITSTSTAQQPNASRPNFVAADPVAAGLNTQPRPQATATAPTDR